MTRRQVPPATPSCLISYNPRPTTQLLAQTSKTDSKDCTNYATAQSSVPEKPKLHETSQSCSDEAAPVTYPQFLLLGDSITEFSTLSLQAFLSTAYIRRLDIVNRGLSGYNSIRGLEALRRFLPLPPSQCLGVADIPLATVFFGANDAVLSEYPQHVPLQRYVLSLIDIIRFPAFKAPHHSPERPTQIILITPPPVNEHQLDDAGRSQRRAGVTGQYALAASRLGASHGLNVHVLDLWSLFMTRVGWTSSMGRECCAEHLDHALIVAPDPSNTSSRLTPYITDVHIPGCYHLPASRLPGAEHSLEDFLVDGIHLTTTGYEVLFEELMRKIHQEIPQCAPQNIPMVMEDWKEMLRTS